jgi:hypothetical protein
MKTFYYYENSRKRYRASHSASGYIGYAMEYKVKSADVLGRKFYNWVCVVEMVSKLKFKEVKPLIDKKVMVDREVKSSTRVINTNPFLEYMSELE